ncbi:hypothetical protein BT67DRAFT_458321 [Trichocladium antarcticum]|uniref:Uncharacterized protein n=1 Tax=Trichocladium antarcticum TaxID=1450529 RepID=A0AAN6UG95_9PEZI|nr:hypothetical protein BT67DRAFT_458321 [Trichocladium antarcticum]
MNRPTLQNLKVSEAIAPNKYELLEKTRDKGAVQTVKNILDRALLILETTKGRKALVYHAKDIVTELIQQKGKHLYPTNDLQNFTKMPGYINTFLQSLRDNFPRVKIENDGEEDAAFARAQWAPKTPGTTLESKSCVFVASDSGELFFTWDIMDPLFKSQNHEDILKWQFHMIISVVHELGHCLTGYLSGDPTALTPKQMWATTSRARDQPGVPYAFKDFYKDTKGQRISMRYLEKFMSGTAGLHVDVPDPHQTHAHVFEARLGRLSRLRRLGYHSFYLESKGAARLSLSAPETARWQNNPSAYSTKDRRSEAEAAGLGFLASAADHRKQRRGIFS